MSNLANFIVIEVRQEIPTKKLEWAPRFSEIPELNFSKIF